MPTYTYKCKECGDTWETPLSVSEIDVPLGNKCVICDADAIVRLIGNSGGFRLGSKGNVSWGKGGYSTLLGDVWKAQRS